MTITPKHREVAFELMTRDPHVLQGDINDAAELLANNFTPLSTHQEAVAILKAVWNYGGRVPLSLLEEINAFLQTHTPEQLKDETNKVVPLEPQGSRTGSTPASSTIDRFALMLRRCMRRLAPGTPTKFYDEIYAVLALCPKHDQNYGKTFNSEEVNANGAKEEKETQANDLRGREVVGMASTGSDIRQSEVDPAAGVPIETRPVNYETGREDGRAEMEEAQNAAGVTEKRSTDEFGGATTCHEAAAVCPEVTRPKGWIDFEQKCPECDSDKVHHTHPGSLPVHFRCTACEAKWEDFGWGNTGRGAA